MHAFYLIQAGNSRVYVYATLLRAFLIGSAEFAGRPFKIHRITSY